MKIILDDSSKFKILSDDCLTLSVKQENKINRILTKSKDSKEISYSVYNMLYASGGKPGVLFALPNIHVEGIPLRIILSAIGTTGYDFTKFFVPLLVSFMTNEHSIKDSFSFTQEIS